MPDAHKNEHKNAHKNEQKAELAMAGDGGKPSATAGPTIADYRFADNPAMNRAWLRNVIFGLAIALPLALFGLGAQLWGAEELLFVFGIPVISCMVLLPVYAAIVRELA